MKSKILVIVIMFVFVCKAQDIYTTNNNGKVFLNNEKLSNDKVRELMTNNTEALRLYNAGIMKKSFGNILLYGGIGTVIIKHLTAVERNKIVGNNGGTNVESTNNIMYFVGAGMIVAAIPIKIGFKNKIKNAVQLLNQPNQNKTEIESNIIVNSNGFGLQIRF